MATAAKGFPGHTRRGPHIGDTVRLCWHQASGNSVVSSAEELEAATVRRFLVVTIGVFVAEGVNVVLASERQPNGALRQVITVPSENVVSLERIGVGWEGPPSRVKRPPTDKTGE